MLSSESSLPDKPGKNQRYTRLLFFIGAAVIHTLILIGIMTRTQEQTPVVVVGTVYPITPRPRYMANGVAAGDPKAKVRIDVYEDFQCPACREYTMALEPQLMRNDIATGRAYYVFHSFLIIDRATWDSPVKESHQAANAAMCAADQNRFWDYHDMLFNNWTGENVGDFTDARLAAYAQSLQLDIGKFNACFKANRFRAKIDADIVAGTKLGVNGTPAIFVNGVQVTPGYMPIYNQILQAIDAAQSKYRSEPPIYTIEHICYNATCRDFLA